MSRVDDNNLTATAPYRWWLVQGIIPETPYFVLFHLGEFLSSWIIITIIVIRIEIITIIIIRIIKQIAIISYIYIYIVFLEWYQEQLHLQSFYGRRARRTLGSWRQRRSANCRCVSACLRGFDRNGSREPRSDLPYGKRLQNWLVVWICLFSPVVGMMIQSD